LENVAKESEQVREQKKQQIENLKNQLQAIASGVASDEGILK